MSQRPVHCRIARAFAIVGKIWIVRLAASARKPNVERVEYVLYGKYFRADEQLAASRLRHVDVEVHRGQQTVEDMLVRLGHERLQRHGDDRQPQARHRGHLARPAGRRVHDEAGGDRAAIRPNAPALPVDHVDAGDRASARGCGRPGASRSRRIPRPPSRAARTSRAGGRTHRPPATRRRRSGRHSGFILRDLGGGERRRSGRRRRGSGGTCHAPPRASPTYDRDRARPGSRTTG